MEDEGLQGLWVILLTFLGAFVLAVLTLPPWLAWWRPEWVALVLIYWAIALPHRIGVFAGLLAGIGLDVLEGAVFGQNAFALAAVALLSLILYQRLRVFNLWQQAAVVFVLVGVNQIICQWVQNLQGIGEPTPRIFLPAVTSALVWPVILHLLRAMRRYYRVA